MVPTRWRRWLQFCGSESHLGCSIQSFLISVSMNSNSSIWPAVCLLKVNVFTCYTSKINDTPAFFLDQRQKHLGDVNQSPEVYVGHAFVVLQWLPFDWADSCDASVVYYAPQTCKIGQSGNYNYCHFVGQRGTFYGLNWEIRELKGILARWNKPTLSVFSVFIFSMPCKLIIIVIQFMFLGIIHFGPVSELILTLA